MVKEVKNIGESYIVENYEKASLVQLVEHWSPKSGVEGSSPSGRVFNLKTNSF